MGTKKRQSKTQPPPVGPYATAVWDEARQEWSMSLSDDGRAFLTDWFARHGSGIGLLRHAYKSVYRQAVRAGLDDEKIESTCCLAAVRALATYHPAKAKFPTYLGWYLRSFVQTETEREKRSYDAGVNVMSLWVCEAQVIDPPVYGDSEEQAEVNDQTRRLWEIVRRAVPSERDRGILALRFDLEGRGYRATLDEIGQRLGLSKERVRQIEARAIRDLRLVLSAETKFTPGRLA